jgi:hypothetical protein
MICVLRDPFFRSSCTNERNIFHTCVMIPSDTLECQTGFTMSHK